MTSPQRPRSRPRPRRGAAAVAARIDHRAERRRALVLTLGLLLAFAGIAAQLVMLGVKGTLAPREEAASSLGRLVARPDIVDRKGRLLATDIITHSLFADPAGIRDIDEALERLVETLPGLDAAALRKSLEDRSRRFVWVERELSPSEAKRVHDLGLPGFDFRAELTRAYPSGDHEGHLLGYVDGDYHGRSGIERYIDEVVGVEAVEGPVRSTKPPVRLTIDLAVQHAVRSELMAARERFEAKAAGAVLIDARSGEVIAIATVPGFAAGDAAATLDEALLDRMAAGSFELGSVFKAVTLAVATERGLAGPEALFDAREPITVSRFTIKDLHPESRELTAEEVFLKSSNIGAARMGEAIGEEGLKAIIADLGLDKPAATEIGPGGRPILPAPWTEASTLTVPYGHGIAVSPLAFAAASAALVEDGRTLRPVLVGGPVAGEDARPRVFSKETVDRMRELFRANVVHGTGKRADVPGYEVGGKTGTADIPGRGGYGGGGVVASFLAAFPMSSPRYILYTVLWEPKAAEGQGGETTAGHNAVPTAGAIITRVAPLLGMGPNMAGGE
jgi:cell division protein FtsI (penicillin-binding protein 3)